MKEQRIVGVDIGGTFVRAGIADDHNKIILGQTAKSAELFSQGDACENLTAWLEQLIEKAGCTVSAISLGVPSIINRERTVILSTPNIRGLDNIPIVQILSRRFGIPCFLEKDACMLLYNDIYQNEIPMNGILVGIYLGTGIGNEVLISGEPLIGKNGVACELGHIPCVEKREFCTCGNRGCLEVFSSGRALEKLCAVYYPDTEIQDIFVKHGKEERILRFVDNLSIPVATEVNIFDPDHLIIGGGLPAMASFPKEWFEACILAHSRKPLPAGRLEMIYSRPSQENGIIGAAIYARNKLSMNGKSIS